MIIFFQNLIFASFMISFLDGQELNARIQERIDKLSPSYFSSLAEKYQICYGYKENQQIVPYHMPCTIFPKIVKDEDVEKLRIKSKIQQELISKIANDYQWQLPHVQELAKVDEFIQKMFIIQQKVLQSNNASPYNFCIVRNDFLYHKETARWTQVEYNCIAVGLCFMSDQVQNYHQELLDTTYQDIANQYKIKLKKSQNTQLLTDGIDQAFTLYGNPNAIGLLIVAEIEQNIFDQKLAQEAIQNGKRLCIRTTFKELRQEMKLDNNSNLSFKGQEVGFVYFRTGYKDEQYEPEDWIVREKIELSKAIKCPNISTQLINFKKFQEILQSQQELLKFLDEESAQSVSENFCRFWNFDEQSENILEMISKHPQKYVLKPQKEGGGNNYYEEQIMEQLLQLNNEKRKEYILMERIKGDGEIAFQMTKGKIRPINSVSEIGIIGYFISKGEEIIKNEIGGYLLRTKDEINNEGGISSGTSVIDSIAILEK